MLIFFSNFSMNDTFLIFQMNLKGSKCVWKLIGVFTVHLSPKVGLGIGEENHNRLSGN